MPLTASLYVPGKLDDAEKVLVDVGTGYFIEVSGARFSLPTQLNTSSLFLCFCFFLNVKNWNCVNVS